MGGKEKEKGRKEGEWTGEEGGKKSFAPSPSLEAFNEDRLTRSLTKELVAERGKVIVIIIIIIAACVQNLCSSLSFFFFDLVEELFTISDAFRSIARLVQRVEENFNGSNRRGSLEITVNLLYYLD